MKNKLIFIIYLMLCMLVSGKEKPEVNYIKLSPESIERTEYMNTKFTQTINLENTYEKKLKFWVDGKLYYTNENGKKYEIDLDGKSGWTLSPVFGISIGGGRTGTGVGVDMTPDNGSGSKVLRIPSSIEIKPGETGVLDVDFYLIDVKLKKSKEKILRGKITGEIRLEETKKNSADIIIPIDIEVREQ